MSRASVYVFASLISGVSAALILASNPSHTRAHNVKWEQSVYDDCRTTSSCQIAYLNSLEDFCLWAPSQPELDLSITGNTEHTLTSWCTKSTHGTRRIPDGTISWAHFVKTPEFIQITGIGNLTNINVPADGVASVNGESNRVPGLVFTSAYGQPEQIYEWMSFVSHEKFCFRSCNPSKTACPQIYDAFECSEIVSGYHDSGLFKDCIDDIKETSASVASSHYSAYPPSCTGRRTVGNGRAARRAISSTSDSSTPLASSTVTTTSMEAATTITFPSSTSNATTLMNSTASTSTSSFNHTAGHTHRHTRSHYHFTALPTSTSFSSSQNRSSASDLLPMSAALSLTSTTSTTSSDPPSLTPTSSVTSTSTDPSFNSTLIFSSSSSASQRSSFPSSSTPSATPSATSPTPSSLPSTTHSTSSTTPPPVPSSTSSHSSVLTFATPSSPSETTDGLLSTFQNTATQLSSQCAPVQLDVVDAGFITPPPSLQICMVLTIILSTFIGVLII